MTRKRPPDRRYNVTGSTLWRGHVIEVGVGFDPETGATVDAFADIAKGGQMQHVISDACIVISIALQCGASLDELQHSMGGEWVTVDSKTVWEPCSPVGATLAAVKAIVEGQE